MFAAGKLLFCYVEHPLTNCLTPTVSKIGMSTLDRFDMLTFGGAVEGQESEAESADIFSPRRTLAPSR
jgi:hypothetical protein